MGNANCDAAVDLAPDGPLPIAGERSAPTRGAPCTESSWSEAKGWSGVGATGAGDVTAIYPRVLNALIGTRFRVVAGYRGTTDLNLAIERGEVALPWHLGGQADFFMLFVVSSAAAAVLSKASRSKPVVADRLMEHDQISCGTPAVLLL